jgi:hypothetical protein
MGLLFWRDCRGQKVGGQGRAEWIERSSSTASTQVQEQGTRESERVQVGDYIGYSRMLLRQDCCDKRDSCAVAMDTCRFPIRQVCFAWKPMIGRLTCCALNASFMAVIKLYSLKYVPSGASSSSRSALHIRSRTRPGLDSALMRLMGCPQKAPICSYDTKCRQHAFPAFASLCCATS